MTDLPGFFDFDENRLALLRSTSRTLVDVFGAHGYQRVEPPVIDWSNAFLERSGEGIREQVYMFDDPRGRELCLRPELTIPVCRLLLRSDWSREHPVRLCYSGPAFRHDRQGRNSFRQFHQAGVEFVGRADPLAAEAEVMALAHDAVAAAGVGDFRIKLGDVRFFLALLDHYRLPETLKTQVRRSFFRARGLTELLTKAQNGEHAVQPLSAEQDAIVTAISELGPEKAAGFIRGFLSVADVNFIGTRSMDEIVERLIDNSLDRLEGLPAEAAAQIQSFLTIGGPPKEALGEIAAFAEAVGLDLSALIEACDRRVGLLQAYGVDTGRLWLGTGQKRDIEYYTGLVFEIVHGDGEAETSIGGGGRYDQLIATLDDTVDQPAIGFALNIERLMMAVEPDVFAQPLSIRSPIDARIRSEETVDTGEAIEAAQALRAAGWRVSLSLSPDTAEENGPPPRFEVALKGKKAGSPVATIADSQSKETKDVPVDELVSYAQGITL